MRRYKQINFGTKPIKNKHRDSLFKESLKNRSIIPIVYLRHIIVNIHVMTLFSSHFPTCSHINVKGMMKFSFEPTRNIRTALKSCGVDYVPFYMITRNENAQRTF